MTSTVEWKGDEFVKSVIIPAAHDGLADAARRVQTTMSNLLNGPSPSLPGSPPGNDTGALVNSIVHTKPRNLRVSIGTNLPYGLTLEKGATIMARGKFLTIPLSDKAKRLRRQNVSLRNVKSPKLSFIRTPSGAYLVRNVGGASKRTEFWFKLVQSVTIAPRPWAAPALKAAKPALQAAFSKGMEKGIARRAGAAL